MFLTELICNLVIYFVEFWHKKKNTRASERWFVYKKESAEGPSVMALYVCRFVNIFCRHSAMSSLMWPYWEMPIGISASPSFQNSNTFSTAMLNTLHKCNYCFLIIQSHFNLLLWNAMPVHVYVLTILIQEGKCFHIMLMILKCILCIFMQTTKCNKQYIDVS